MQIREALDEFYFHNKQHSTQTQVWYKSRLNAFAVWCEGQDLALEQISARVISRYVDELSTRNNSRADKPLSSYTVHAHARVIRTLFNWLAKQEEFDGIVDSRIGKRIPMPRIKHRVVGTFTKEELEALFAACSNNIYPEIISRNRAILAVLLDTGIRAGELCGLKLDDLHLFTTSSFVLVSGKGNKEREIGLGKKSEAALLDYIENHRHASPLEPHVFITHRGEPLTINGLNQMLYRLAERAEVADCHAHKFRHTFACAQIELGTDVFSVSRIMGHEDVQITSSVYLKAVKSRQARILAKSVYDNM